MGTPSWLPAVERAINTETGKVSERAREQTPVQGAWIRGRRGHDYEWVDLPAADRAPCSPAEKAAPFAVGDTIISLVPEHRGSLGEITNPLGESPDAWLVDFGHTKRVLREHQMRHQPIAVNDDADVIEVHAADQLAPLRRYARGGIVGPRPKPLVCDCGHPDSLHSKAPGMGCTHRPYCLCVHPTGQRVPRTRVRL